MRAFYPPGHLHRLRGDGSNLIQDRKYHLSTFKNCFVGKEFVEWLVTRGEAPTRPDAVEIGKQLLETGVIAHGELQTNTPVLVAFACR